MNIWRRVLIVLGGLYGALGVVAAAFDAHMTDSDLLATAARFLIMHAAAIIAIVAASAVVEGGRTALIAGAGALALGTFLFTGDLLMRVVSENEYAWSTAPIGGTVLIVGWIFVAIGGVVVTKRLEMGER